MFKIKTYNAISHKGLERFAPASAAFCLAHRLRC